MDGANVMLYLKLENVGADDVAKLQHWDGYQRLLTHAVVIVVQRKVMHVVRFNL